MSGIYLHIPFCTKKCNYCDFYSIVPQSRKAEFVESLINEISLRKDFLKGEPISTIYFGGGTPSLLQAKQISRILNEIHKSFIISDELEITFEANPENLSKEYLKDIKKEGINRLSVGVQSFSDSDLDFLKRTHSSQKAINSVNDAFSVGIENISIDLIYGLPSLSIPQWESNLKKAFELPIKHLSSYHLTYEEGTLLYKKLKQGKVIPLQEDMSIQQFRILLDYTNAKGFPYYEISNFAYKEMYSKHNLSYWQQKKYLGLGPSAHSYNGKIREWNMSHLNKYIEGIKSGDRMCEEELLSSKDLANEYLITNLRTKWGIDTLLCKRKFGEDFFNYVLAEAMPFINLEMMTLEDDILRLTAKGILVSDLILEKLYKL